MELQRANEPCHGRQQKVELRDGIHDGFLVLLQVAVVRQRQPLERGQQSGQIADQAAGLAAGYALDRIAADHGFSPWRARFQGLVAEGRLNTKGQAVVSRSKTGRGKVTAPIFLLVPQVKLPKRLDLARDAEQARDAVPGLIVANWVEGRV